MKSVDGSSAAPLTNVAAAGLGCPPGCFEQRAQLCVKSADSGPSPSRPGCLWNLELRCNVGESGSCFDEARSGFLSTSTTRTFALLLSLCQLSLSFTALFSPVLHTFTAQYSLCLSILSSFPHLFCFSPCLLFPPPPRLLHPSFAWWQRLLALLVSVQGSSATRCAYLFILLSFSGYVCTLYLNMKCIKHHMCRSWQCRQPSASWQDGAELHPC